MKMVTDCLQTITDALIQNCGLADAPVQIKIDNTLYEIKDFEYDETIDEYVMTVANPYEKTHLFEICERGIWDNGRDKQLSWWELMDLLNDLNESNKRLEKENNLSNEQLALLRGIVRYATKIINKNCSDEVKKEWEKKLKE